MRLPRLAFPTALLLLFAAVPAAAVWPYMVFFDIGSSRLSPQARSILDGVKPGWDSLAGRGGRPAVTIVGAADRAGPAAANRRLACRRARAVRDYLVAAGLDHADIRVGGTGEDAPLVETADGVAEPQNRNVQIVIGMPWSEPDIDWKKDWPSAAAPC